MTVSFALIKKVSLYKMKYFPELYTLSKNKVKFELDLSNYATKSDLENAAGVDASKLAKQTDLVSSDSDIHDLDIDNLKVVPVDL